MKARIKTTGEIVKVDNLYDDGTALVEGIYFNISELDFFEDFETIDWEQRRYEIAKEVLSGILIWIAYSGEDSYCTENCKHAVKYADELVRQLKGE